MPTAKRFGREVILGASKYCVTHHVLLLQAGPMNEDQLIHVRNVAAKGLVTYGITPAGQEQLRQWDVRFVNVSGQMDCVGTDSVLCDDLAIGKAGAEHLISRGLRSLVFVGNSGCRYSELRSQGFEAGAVGANSVVVHNIQASDNSIDHEHLGQWLDSLPKPVGVMACDDLFSRQLLESCRLRHLRVPHDVAILGVDNDEVVCQGSDPMLSSVDPNAFRVGYEAAAMLHRLLEGKAARSPVLVPTLGVIARASTHTIVVDDPEVNRVLLFIHSRSAMPLDVAETSLQVGINRRTLERRFRRALGYGVAEAIQRSHVERAKHLLVDTDIPFKQIAVKSGLKTVRQLNIAFDREMGISPAAFRLASKQR